MRGRTWERWSAISGIAALAVAAVAVTFERAVPDPEQTPQEVVAFYSDHRTALLVQSLLFVLSSGIFLWFLAGVRSFLTRVEGHAERVSSVANTAGLVWIVLTMAVQAPQLALADAAGGDLSPQVAATVNGIGLALSAIAYIPVVVLTVAVGVLAFRADVLPGWLGWLSALAATVHLVAWFGVAADTGPLAPGGWATFAVYPVFVVWLAGVITVMITGGPRPDTAPPDR